MTPDRKRMKGVARVAFIAHLDTIAAELDAGWPIKAVYEKHSASLNMSYAQFARYVDQIVRRGHRTTSQARPSPHPPSPADLPRLAAPVTAPEGNRHAGYRAARTFNHDPLERPDDRRRLLGED